MQHTKQRATTDEMIREIIKKIRYCSIAQSRDQNEMKKIK